MSHTAPRPTHNRHAPKTQTTSPKTPQIHAFSPKWSAFWAIPCPAPVDWRGWKAPEGPEGLAAVLVGVGGAWPDRETTRQARPLHTRPHWCGGRRRDRRARAGFETRHRAKLAARTARGRAAAHRHTQRPGPPAPGTPVRPQATPSLGRAAAHGHTKQPGPAAGSDGTRNTRGATSNPAQQAPDNGYDSETSPRGSRRDRPRYRLMAAPTSMRRGRARNAG